MINYPLADLERDIESLIGELAEVRKAKGHDYSSDADTLENMRDWGWQGVLVRIGDKYKRLMNTVKKGNVACKDESVEDTMQDLINYALFMLIMYRQEK